MTALRAHASRDLQPQLQRLGELTLDTAARTVSVADTTVEVSAKEWDLLLTLASQPTRVFTKQELLREVWRTDWAGSSRTVDSHACRLRAKLAAAGARNTVVNVWGVGYRLTDALTSPSTA